MKSFICTVCGYIHVGDQPPETCPVCGASAAEFVIHEEKTKATKEPTTSWRCLNCEYIHYGPQAPDECIVCGVKKDMFESYDKNQQEKVNIDQLKIVIIGGGIAGLSCAEEIRNNTDKAEIVLVTDDPHLPYYRLNLSRYLAKEINRESLDIYSANWYEEKRIKLISGTPVSEINKEKKQVQLIDDTKIEYDKLIIANGAHPFVPPIPGKELENVQTVRNIEDVDFIFERMEEIDSCICIGGGILGLEVAGAIAKSGIKVTLLEGAQWLMPRQLNKKAALVLKKYLKNIGVEVYEDVKIQEILGQVDCQGVKLATGEVLPTKLVIITAGVRPNSHLARKTGLEVNNGLVVNNHMQTSDENIYAAGDVTEHYGIVYGLWNVAQFQGKIAAHNVIGMHSEFGGIPRSNVLKVLGLDMFSIGEFIPVDGSYNVYEKETPESYVTFVMRDGKIVGSIVIGDKHLSIKVKQAVEKELSFPNERYDDIDVLIGKLEELI